MFSEKIEQYRQQFQGGVFNLENDGKLRQAIRQAAVPRKPGVYIITGSLNGEHSVFYIGMAGKIKRDGTFRNQMLPSRLTALQRWNGQRVSRRKFFQDRMRELNLNQLSFEWFVTFDGGTRVMPCWAETQLLQAYFDENRTLPLWNHEA